MKNIKSTKCTLCQATIMYYPKGQLKQSLYKNLAIVDHLKTLHNGEYLKAVGK
jgi:hypothetical protein